MPIRGFGRVAGGPGKAQRAQESRAYSAEARCVPRLPAR
jgi:hypothetical protein